MTSRLTGTTALVTGASSGIGAATARQLAALGASVALVARRRDRLEALAAEIEQAGGTALVIEADITDRAQAQAAVDRTVERFGQLDILVNNAGLMLLGPVVGADPEDWERMIAVNVQGLLHTTHAALPHLLKAAEDSTRRVADIVCGGRRGDDQGVEAAKFPVEGDGVRAAADGFHERGPASQRTGEPHSLNESVADEVDSSFLTENNPEDAFRGPDVGYRGGHDLIGNF